MQNCPGCGRLFSETRYHALAGFSGGLDGARVEFICLHNGERRCSLDVVGPEAERFRREFAAHRGAVDPVRGVVGL